MPQVILEPGLGRCSKLLGRGIAPCLLVLPVFWFLRFFRRVRRLCSVGCILATFPSLLEIELLEVVEDELPYDVAKAMRKAGKCPSCRRPKWAKVDLELCYEDQSARETPRVLDTITNLTTSVHICQPPRRGHPLHLARLGQSSARAPEPLERREQLLRLANTA